MLCVLAKAQLHANFKANVPLDCAPVAVQFSDSTKGNPTQWFWSFGNGDTSHLQNPMEVFTAAGNYVVKLVASNKNYTDSFTQTIVITGSVKAGFTYQYDNACSAPSAFVFAAKNAQDTINYIWNFDNGKTATSSNASTVFGSNGTYNVSLITTTPQGCKDTATQAFAIGSAAAGFSSYSVVCANAPATFTNTSNVTPLSINWLVNGSGAGSGNTLTYMFTTPGTYTVSMNANFGACTKSAQKQIMVNNKPVPAFTQSGNLQSCTLPFTVDFTNSSRNATSYNWLFGDGNSLTGTNVSYTYNKAGSFSVSLVASNGDGCNDTLTKPNLVRLGPPVITSFTALPKSGCIPENITSGANISSPDSVVAYDWNTGDNNLHVSGSPFTHAYNNEGYYDVSLTVTTKNSCTGNFSLHQAVAAGKKPSADFAVDKPTVCASTPVQFIDKSIGTVTSWNWNFGDGTSVSGTNRPTHLFTKVGTNDVTLYESNKGCAADPKTIRSIVTILPPIAKFGVMYNCANPLQVSFTDSSVQPTSWLWNFGDKSTATLQDPSYTYTASGTYQVVLTSSDSNSQCSSSDTQTVVVNNAKPNLVVQPSNSFVCRKDSVRLSAVSSTGLIAKYTWNVGDGSSASNDSTVSHVYKTAGTFKPFVVVQYTNQCKDTIYTNAPVNVYGPTALFTVSQNGSCLPVGVTFTNNSTTDNINPIASTTWLYGNGETDNVTNATHVYTYQMGGSFMPRLIVKDAAGCVDSFASKTPIVAKGVAAGFVYNISSSCDSATVSCTDTSKLYNDAINYYFWNFGNGIYSSSQNATYTYHSSGNYKITQTVTTQSGCLENTSQTINIEIAAKPNLTISGPMKGCVASGVDLSAAVSGTNPVQQWTWNTGDGSSITGQKIGTVYNQPGTYNISVTAAFQGGCSDTAYQKIIIDSLPQINAGNDSVVCAGKSIVLDATGGNTYTWQDVANSLSCTACASPTATPATSTNYVVTGKSVIGCTNTDSVFIKVQQKEMITVAPSEVSVCSGKAVQLHASGADAYGWEPYTGMYDNTVANPVATLTSSIVYTVIGNDNHHCFSDSEQVTVTVDPLPHFNIVDSVITIGKGATQMIQTTSSPDVVRWLWKPATGLSCSDCAQPILTAAINGIYTATAYTAAGCSDSDEVKVMLLCNQSGIFIPAAFTPNGDGKNDFFYPASFAASKVVSFTVFSRNGTVVFHRTNTSTNANKDGWDGTYQSLPLPADTYIYKIEVECEKKTIAFTGTVVLIR